MEGGARLYEKAMPDLAPSIYRQRLVVEGTRRSPIGSSDVERYLEDLTEVCGMRLLIPPVTHRSERFGWAGWVHWEESGAHFYAWDDPIFFSVDVYTCSSFDAERVVSFTARALDADRVVGKAV